MICKLTVYIILIFLLISTQSCTLAIIALAKSTPDTTIPPESLVEELIDWIEANTDLNDDGSTRPTIRLAGVAYMEQQWIEITGEPYVGGIRALHIWNQTGVGGEKSVILLPLGFDPSRALHRRTLIHELVHHLQHVNGKDAELTDECSGVLEWDARVISSKYIRSLGLNMYFYTIGDNELRDLTEHCRN